MSGALTCAYSVRDMQGGRMMIVWNPRIACAAMVGALFFLAACAGEARAEWRRATSEHFEVYGASFESEIVDAARELEAFDRLLRQLTSTPRDESANRLKVYIVSDLNALRQVSPGMGETVAGFYSASSGETVAVALRMRDRRTLSSRHILFHEYAHHFMLAHHPGVYPAWYIEGFAEYVATAVIADGAIEVGRLAPGRISELASFPWTPIADLLTKRQLEVRNPETYYGLSWLLTHYMSSPERAPAFGRYLRAVAAGADGVSAYQESFGEPAAALEGKLKTYVRGAIPYLKSQVPQGGDISVRVETLPSSATTLLLSSVRIAIGRDFASDGEGEMARARFLAEIREAVGRFPGDPFAQKVLANAEINYGDPRRAVTLLGDRQALAGDAERLYLAGLARLKVSERSPEDAGAMLEEARRFLGDAHKVDPDHYQTLYRYGETFAGEAATENTLNVVLLAQQLAPQVAEIRLNAAQMLIRRRAFSDAIALLQPLLNDPHDRASSVAAQALINHARAGAAQ